MRVSKSRRTVRCINVPSYRFLMEMILCSSLSHTSLTTIPAVLFNFTNLQRLRLNGNPLLRLDSTSAPSSADTLSRSQSCKRSFHSIYLVAQDPTHAIPTVTCPRVSWHKSQCDWQSLHQIYKPYPWLTMFLKNHPDCTFRQTIFSNFCEYYYLMNSPEQ